MRVGKLLDLFRLSRLDRLKKDFSNPLKALVAVSGVFSSKFELRAGEYNFVTDRSDALIWAEYFSQKQCHVKIERGLFHIIPFDTQCPDYFIKGCTGRVTYQPERCNYQTAPGLIKELQESEWSRYSQHGEDGIIEKLLGVIGAKHDYIVEFGAHDGISMSNSRYFIAEKKWRAFLIEAKSIFFSQLKKLYQDNNKVVIKHSFITKQNINGLFKDAGVPYDFDVLSIDVDGPDYYLWEALTDFAPRIVIVEYNSSKLPTDDYVVAEDKVFEYGATKDEGASLLAFYKLGTEKGYQAIYTELYGSNLFFIHQSLSDKFNIEGIDPVSLYQPPQFGELAGTPTLSGRGYK